MSDYTTVYTLRHAQTEFNVQRRYAGTMDVLLSKIGIEDTKRASQKLIEMRFDVVITSTLKRAVETARLLWGDDIALIRCALCNERNYGLMQGLSEDEAKLIEPKVKFVEIGDDYHSLNPPHGETFAMLRKRAEKFYELIFTEYMGLTVMVISHGVFLQQFHGLVRGLSWKQSLVRALVVPLELSRFLLRGTQLVHESAFKLVERDQGNW